MNKGKKKKNTMGTGRKIILILCLMVFCGSGAYIGLYYKDKITAQSRLEKLAELNADLGLESVFEENTDTIGWIKINGTRIDYPVMQTKDDPEYYLHRDFQKNYSDVGTPFMAAESDIGDSQFRGSSWNWLIYGHNIKSGIMFHDLLKYKDENFWQENQIVDLAIIRDGQVSRYKFQVFAVAEARIFDKAEKGFRYYNYSGYTDEDSFNEYVQGVKKLSLYDTGTTPQFGEQLITLSTCAYHTDEGRFFIAAVRR